MEVASSAGCAGLYNRTGPLTVVNILDIQDVLPGESAVFPFTIENREYSDKSYTVTIRGLEPWASYTVNPTSLIVVPAGQSRGGEIVFHVAEEAMPGPYSFVVDVSTRDEVEQRLLVARVQALPSKAPFFSQYFVLGITIVVIALILFAAILVLVKSSRGKPS
jgi:hypothetical protein